MPPRVRSVVVADRSVREEVGSAPMNTMPMVRPLCAGMFVLFLALTHQMATRHESEGWGRIEG